MPKTALETLQQFKGLPIGNFFVEAGSKGNFIASVNVDSKLYTAQGRTKKTAMNLVYELAFSLAYLADTFVSYK